MLLLLDSREWTSFWLGKAHIPTKHKNRQCWCSIRVSPYHFREEERKEKKKKTTVESDLLWVSHQFTNWSWESWARPAEIRARLGSDTEWWESHEGWEAAGGVFFICDDSSWEQDGSLPGLFINQKIFRISIQPQDPHSSSMTWNFPTDDDNLAPQNTKKEKLAQSRKPLP